MLPWCPVDSDRPLTQEELEQLRQNLSRLSEPSVRKVYDEAWEQCRLKDRRIPSPKVVQQLVTAWKQLWQWR